MKNSVTNVNITKLDQRNRSGMNHA